MINMPDHDTLMIDALDGALSTEGRAQFDAWLAADPGARENYAALQRLEAGLARSAMAAPPAHFAVQVMGAVRGARVARSFSPRTLFLILGTNTLLLTFVWALCAVALSGLAAFLLPAGVREALFALGRGVADVAGIFVRAGRLLSATPVFWAALIAALATILVWFAVLARVLRPRFAYGS